MLDGFKKFIMRGNAVDLAVGVVIGAAFGAVVTSLVTDIITPLISAIVKQPDFSTWDVVVNGSSITYGNFLNAVIGFIIVAAAIYFGAVMPMNKIMARMRKGEEPTTKACTECLSDMPLEAKRCANCTYPVSS